MFRFVNFMTKDVCDYEFLHQTRLKNVPKAIQGSNLLSLSDEADDLVDVIH